MPEGENFQTPPPVKVLYEMSDRVPVGAMGGYAYGPVQTPSIHARHEFTPDVGTKKNGLSEATPAALITDRTFELDNLDLVFRSEKQEITCNKITPRQTLLFADLPVSEAHPSVHNQIDNNSTDN